ncbi:hypothetical protein OG705_29555 [Streptomyces sp. NBC_00838]|uniref:hypothetical protein n=1 Tax=Streptomyces sp. NBC_00838 TaxID=2903680 RepID=UPI00386988A5|nr:hypothetical protein OG705_29555 [Streptomyces sp. NBC_00838]
MHPPPAITPTAVAIQAADPLSHAGVTRPLRPRPEITLMERDTADATPEVVRRRRTRRADRPGRAGPVTVATTCASLPVIAEAHHAHAMAPFDLLVSDDAVPAGRMQEARGALGGPP